MSKDQLLILLRGLAAQLVILVGAYVSLGTSCGSVVKDVDLVAHTQMPPDVGQKQLRLSIAADGTIREVRLRFDPGIAIVVDTINADPLGAGDPTPPTLNDDTTIVACEAAACEELLVTLYRDDATDQLNLSLSVSVLVEGRDCGSEPEFVELEVTELG